MDRFKTTANSPFSNSEKIFLAQCRLTDLSSVIMTFSQRPPVTNYSLFVVVVLNVVVAVSRVAMATYHSKCSS